MATREDKMQPTKPKCFWCGKEKNKPEDIKKFDEYLKAHLPWKYFQPEYSDIFYEPCDECKAKMENKITLIGTAPTAPDARPLINPGSYPTGFWLVMSDKEAYEKIGKTVIDSVIKHNKRRLTVNSPRSKEYTEACRIAAGEVYLCLENNELVLRR